MAAYQQLRFFGDDPLAPLREVDPLVWLAFGAGILAIVAAVVIGHIIERRATRNRSWSSPFAITSPEDIDRLLDEAIRQRSKFSVSLGEGLLRRKPIHSTLLGINETSLVLEASSMAISQPDRVVGRDVSVFFKLVPRQKKRAQPNYYTMESTVTKAGIKGRDLVIFELKLPSSILLQQRRTHLRMEPPHHQILGMSLWPAIYGDGNSFHANPSAWGQPALKKGDDLQVLNISGGGMRIAASPSPAQRSQLRFSHGARFFILLDLLSPEAGNERLRFWLAAEVKNSFDDALTGALELGVQFVASGTADPDSKPLLRWEPVGENGVVRIADWVVKRHLESYRTKAFA